MVVKEEGQQKVEKVEKVEKVGRDVTDRVTVMRRTSPRV